MWQKLKTLLTPSKVWDAIKGLLQAAIVFIAYLAGRKSQRSDDQQKRLRNIEKENEALKSPDPDPVRVRDWMRSN